MGRHRHTACVRSDGLLATVGPLLDRRRVVAATLVDVGSGLLLDGYTHDPALPELDLLGAVHAELARAAAALAPEPGELVVGRSGYHHVLRPVADPHGDPLLLSAVVQGAHRHAVRALRHLRRVPVRGLTAGPAVDRRSGGTWVPSWDDDRPGPPPPPGGPDHPAAPPPGLLRAGVPSPPSAIVPLRPDAPS
jgi:hypothetical protein